MFKILLLTSLVSAGYNDDLFGQYTVDGLVVDTLVPNGLISPSYNKVLIQLHGAGGDSDEWIYAYFYGQYGNYTNNASLKFVWPTSHRQDHRWL